MFFVNLDNNHLSFGTFDNSAIPYRWHEDGSAALYTIGIPEAVQNWLSVHTSDRYYHVIDRHLDNIDDVTFFVSDINHPGYSWTEDMYPVHELCFVNLNDALKFKLRFT
jgi:hypothetical protein